MARNFDAPIISRPDRQSAGQRYGQRLLTLMFWLLTAYLLRPLITLIAWAAGLRLFSEIMIDEEGLVSLFQLLGSYVLIIAGIGAALGSWALYNLLRFRGRDKRTRHPRPVSPEEEASHYGLDPEAVRQWRQCRRLLVRHDANGRPLTAETLD